MKFNKLIIVQLILKMIYWTPSLTETRGMFEICKLSAPNLNSIWDIQNYSEIFRDLMFLNSDKLEVQRLYSMDLF